MTVISNRSALAAAAVLLLAGCRQAVDPCAPPPGFQPPGPEPVVAVSPATLALAPGERGSVSAVVTGIGVAPCGVSGTVGWRSSNAAVARVEADTGNTVTVLGVAAGAASVSARLIADSSRRAAAAVTVSGAQAALRSPGEGTR